MNPLRTLCVVLLLATAPAAAIEESDIPFPTSASLPPDAMQALRTFPGSSRYALRANLNPYFLQGDFNGDGRLDTAVLVKEKATGKDGIAVVHGPGAIFIVGAGNDTGGRGDNYDWLDAWYVVPKGRVDQGIGEAGAPPRLLGDALMVIKTEAASALVYWTGKHYEWYQQGD